MSETKYSNYVGEGPEAEAAIQQAKDMAGKTMKDATALAGPMGLDAGQDRNGHIVCFIGKDSHLMDAGQMKNLGLRDRGGLLKIDGEFRKAYIPDRRYKAGKELEKKLGHINSSATSISRALVKILGVGRTIFTGRAMISSTAGFDGGKVLVRIPGSVDDDGHTSDKFPDIPSWLREPQGDEWKAFMR